MLNNESCTDGRLAILEKVVLLQTGGTSFEQNDSVCDIILSNIWQLDNFYVLYHRYTSLFKAWTVKNVTTDITS
jgi:hypothetical protein